MSVSSALPDGPGGGRPPNRSDRPPRWLAASAPGQAPFSRAGALGLRALRQAPQVEADVVVLAGDIHAGVQGVSWAQRQFPRTPVIYVPGNHEYYGEDLPEMRERLRQQGEKCGIHVLDGNEVTIQGVRFLGATLWTDFALNGSKPSVVSGAMAYADKAMDDFEVICFREGRFTAQHSRGLHMEQVQWLTAALAAGGDTPIVVVTHHLPHRLSVHKRYQGGPLNPAFASDLDRLVRAPVTLWIHGHTHQACDYGVNGTRVVCNPRGYEVEGDGDWDPTLVIRVPMARVAYANTSGTQSARPDGAR